MLSKFILIIETHFQNTETALKNQKALIQGLETQIGQLSKLISEQPQGSLPRNTESNPREHLNAISTQDTEGFITPEPEIQQDNAMNKGREEELPRTKTTEIVCYYNEENKDVHEERRLWREELDEWREHKPSTHDKPKLHKTSPIPLLINFSEGESSQVRHFQGTLCRHQEEIRSRSYPQRDVGDRVLPRCVLQLKFGTQSLNFHKLRRRSYFRYYVHDPSPQVMMMNNDDPGTIHFRLGGLVRSMSVPEFGVALGLYTDEFLEEEDMNALPRNNHISPSLCWKALAPLSSTYNPSRSKASDLPHSL
ncbi:hypothetical protein GOBAR_AA16438 [Gossypium barbadense]|uniref:Uncharacterized protein n=1 Tax=Gossypium barbadense TaxID=3634 RepID=A0A2P5XLM4_GOSBA|nr:hypothetical protein GOBAR_AA16438 [Gossypium barbadense]